jgi:hypothetical protein
LPEARRFAARDWKDFKNDKIRKWNKWVDYRDSKKEAIKQAARETWRDVNNKVDSAKQTWNQYVDWRDGKYRDIRDGISKGVSEAGRRWNGWVKYRDGKYGDVSRWTKQTVDTVKESASKKLDEAKIAIVQKYEETTKAISNTLATNSISNAANTIKDAVVDGASVVGGAVTNAVTTSADYLSSGWKKAKSWW